MEDKGNVTVGITYSKNDIEVLDDEINIKLKLKGKIIENVPNYDLKDQKVYKELNKEFEKIIASKVKKFIAVLQKNKSDVLGFQEIYYKKWRKDNYELWEHAKVNVAVELQINTKGFIFEVES